MEELQALPNAALAQLARVLNLIEETGEWPETAVLGLVALIPKAVHSAEPLGQRPITIMPLVYRLWASVRGRQCSSWMGQVADYSCTAGVAGRDAPVRLKGGC